MYLNESETQQLVALIQDVPLDDWQLVNHSCEDRGYPSYDRLWSMSFRAEFKGVSITVRETIALAGLVGVNAGSLAHSIGIGLDDVPAMGLDSLLVGCMPRSRDDWEALCELTMKLRGRFGIKTEIEKRKEQENTRTREARETAERERTEQEVLGGRLREKMRKLGIKE